MSPLPDLILIRHGKVDAAWQGICYGCMDVSLGADGCQDSMTVAASLAQLLKPVVVFHSGLQRTQFLANAIVGDRSDAIEVQEDIRLRERNFGQWQGKSWEDAYASDPDNFHGLIEQPDSYRPPDGETTSEMQKRVVLWFEESVKQFENPSQKPIIALSHSGPIAALAGHLLQLHPRDWTPWIIRPLQGVAVWNLFAEPSQQSSGEQTTVRCTKFDLLTSFGFDAISE